VLEKSPSFKRTQRKYTETANIKLRQANEIATFILFLVVFTVILKSMVIEYWWQLIAGFFVLVFLIMMTVKLVNKNKKTNNCGVGYSFLPFTKKTMIAILKKELWSYFGNWSAWVIIAAFSLIATLFLFFFDNDSNIFEIGMASLQSYFVLVPWLLMFIIPALSMKTFAEEQQTGTLNWLFSQPLKVSDLVSGKFLSVWIVGILCLIPSLIYLYTVYVLGVPAGNIDLGMTFGSYIGLIILIAAFSGVGILASSFHKTRLWLICWAFSCVSSCISGSNSWQVINCWEQTLSFRILVFISIS
jgi:ABC-type transport system involved in multi-copper enzyme maturation permease subunit